MQLWDDNTVYNRYLWHTCSLIGVARAADMAVSSNKDTGLLANSGSLPESHWMRNVFGYQIKHVERYIINCSYADMDTIKTALEKCSFFRMCDQRDVTNIRILRWPDGAWLPHNCPCNLMPDIKVYDEFRLTVERTSTPQPNYPARSIKSRDELFTIEIDLVYGSPGVRVLNVRKTCLTPRTLIVVVDPKMTIRESLKDDGRFSSEVLEGRYTHLRCTSLMSRLYRPKLFPGDMPGKVLERNADYAIYTKAPKGLRIGLRSPRRRKRTSPEM